MRVMAMEGMVVLGGRAEIDDALRRARGLLLEHVGRRPAEHPTAHPAADRPARPQEVPQDPRPAVRATEDGAARGAHRRARQPVDRRLRRPHRHRLRPRVLRPVPVAGLPHAARTPPRRAADVPGHEGRDHPSQPRHRDRVRQRRGDQPPEGHRTVRVRVLRPGHRRAHRATARRPDQSVPRHRDRRPPPDSQRDPRHLLPVPDRRSRHRHRHARLHVRLPERASRAPATARRDDPRSSRPRSRSCCAGRRR